MKIVSSLSQGKTTFRVANAIVFGIGSLNYLWIIYDLNARDGLSEVKQLISWTVMIVSFVLPTISPNSFRDRLIAIMSSLALPYTLMSLSYEPLFLMTFTSNIYYWVSMIYTDKKQLYAVSCLCTDEPSHLRIFRIIKFDSFPKTATIGRNGQNSTDSRCRFQESLHQCKLIKLELTSSCTFQCSLFSPADPVHFGVILRNGKYCFNQLIRSELGSMLCFHVFPISDGLADHCQAIDTHLVGHVCRPIDTCHHKSEFNLAIDFRRILMFSSLAPQVPLDKFFIIILLCCDIMCLNFLFLVKNTGSWLEIGTSISHFVIMEATVVVLCLLQLVAKVLTQGQLQSLMSGRSRDLSFNTPKIE